ncbi:hypothetical protein [Weizmannia acidilactici]|uniref:hypothetical protein n=1 Tax=Weizmannia acidilactici TaxID=2607726 RepID=UPI00124EB5A7|nr:hypothetical protein [Weizmannia acidilactici]GER67380.1 hypothetical protein BpJC4_18510 [Weizmannia acidilactici]GER72620.1 hypothetical protein BpPP18_06870 [Weizmannia acidilactici]
MISKQSQFEKNKPLLYIAQPTSEPVLVNMQKTFIIKTREALPERKAENPEEVLEQAHQHAAGTENRQEEAVHAIDAVESGSPDTITEEHVSHGIAEETGD